MPILSFSSYSSHLKRKLFSPSTGGPKKRKLDEYETLLAEMRTNFNAYQNEAIQKWNNKTKIAAGKMSSSNFSAFDQSVLAQIEHILNDKERLVKRTQQRKSKYGRVGEASVDDQEVRNIQNPVDL